MSFTHAFYPSDLDQYFKMSSDSPESLKLKEAKRKRLVLEIQQELVEKRNNLSFQELETAILTRYYSEHLQSAIARLENYKDRISRCESALPRIEADRSS
jgi:hypothetical protein